MACDPCQNYSSKFCLFMQLCSVNFYVYALNFRKHFKFGSIKFYLQRLNFVVTKIPFGKTDFGPNTI